MNDAAARERKDTETEAEGHGLRVPFSEDAAARARSESETPPPAARRRLARLVAAKLLLDLLFVGAFALYAHSNNFRPTFNGALEHADGRGARGWVVDLERPGATVEVQLFVDGRFVASTGAEETRTDTDAESPHGSRRGFNIELGGELRGEHEARVYAVREGRRGERRTLQPLGGPLRFVWR